ncbi:hypothetical protein [Methanospirillum lacunae]|uniref:Uncharacterized protein n=1 Tax=Methanospirillum lacunae TaxID=668570 RepID=A0A2V2MYH8_9EURY|nr:hypothetical protein [Methanospirillum lacunae]PWR72992.1 hypothetical protein DK846_05800 [Methanospirillum lacunae]
MIEDIQYVYNSTGQKTAVIVPIEIWERVGDIQPGKRTHDLTRYYGAYLDYISESDTVAKVVREDWER